MSSRLVSTAQRGSFNSQGIPSLLLLSGVGSSPVTTCATCRSASVGWVVASYPSYQPHTSWGGCWVWLIYLWFPSNYWSTLGKVNICAPREVRRRLELELMCLDIQVKVFPFSPGTQRVPRRTGYCGWSGPHASGPIMVVSSQLSVKNWSQTVEVRY